MLVFNESNARLNEVGKIGRQTSDMVLSAAQLVKKGQIYPLGTERFDGMPNFPSNIFKVYSTISPRGIRNNPDPAKRFLWDKDVNRVNLGFNADVVISSSHCGTHIDTLAHATVGEDDHWYNGFTYAKDSCDSGIMKADASSFLPLFTRGVLLDVAAFKGADQLTQGYGITAEDLIKTAEWENIKIMDGDTVLIRTGFQDNYPVVNNKTFERAGIDESSAKWLAGKNVYAVGADTESLEQIPCQNSQNPHIVHTILLIESGIHIIESILLKQLSKDGVYEFLFVALPLTNRGASGSLINPIAVV